MARCKTDNIIVKKNSFNRECNKFFVLPIKQAIRNSNYSIRYHVNEMNKKGFKYSYFGLTQTLRLTNGYCRNFDYFFYLYEYFNIPAPTIEYLFECIEIEKQYKTLLKPIDSSMKKKRSNSPRKIK